MREAHGGARSPRTVRRGRATLLAGLLLAASGCRGMTSSQPPVHPNWSMDDQPKVKAQQESDFFYNGSGLMPAYRWPIPPDDRWAIIAYVRTLQQKRSATGG